MAEVAAPISMMDPFTAASDPFCWQGGPEQDFSAAMLFMQQLLQDDAASPGPGPAGAAGCEQLSLTASELMGLDLPPDFLAGGVAAAQAPAQLLAPETTLEPPAAAPPAAASAAAAASQPPVVSLSAPDTGLLPMQPLLQQPQQQWSLAAGLQPPPLPAAQPASQSALGLHSGSGFFSSLQLPVAQPLFGGNPAAQASPAPAAAHHPVEALGGALLSAGGLTSLFAETFGLPAAAPDLPNVTLQPLPLRLPSVPELGVYAGGAAAVPLRKTVSDVASGAAAAAAMPGVAVEPMKRSQSSKPKKMLELEYKVAMARERNINLRAQVQEIQAGNGALALQLRTLQHQASLMHESNALLRAEMMGNRATLEALRSKLLAQQ